MKTLRITTIDSVGDFCYGRMLARRVCVAYTFNLHRINRVSGRARNANMRYVYALGPSPHFRSTIWEEQREKEHRGDARAFACCHVL